MTRKQHAARTVTRLGRALAGALLLASVAAALPQGSGGAMEDFEEVDPYTEGRPELMERLGYLNFGPFTFLGQSRTDTIQLEIGGAPMLFVETEHFLIATTLSSYKFGSDRAEKKKLAGEFEMLEERLGDLDRPRRKMDAWLRMHLFAQRVEGLYSDFVELVDVETDDFAELGPHVGQKQKFVMLLCQRKSEFGRFLRRFLNVEAEVSYRWYLEGGGMGLALDVEGLKDVLRADDETPVDTVLHCSLTSALTANMIVSYRRNNGGSPYWLEVGLGHQMVRQVDERFVLNFGLRTGETVDEDDYKWEPRVRNLVRNDFYVSFEEMAAFESYPDLNKRDHMVCWSKVQFLMTALEGDRGGFFNDVCIVEPLGEPAERLAAEVERQTIALAKHFNLTPAEFDAAWVKWVKNTYKKK